jgi:hypothetical protein
MELETSETVSCLGGKDSSKAVCERKKSILYMRGSHWSCSSASFVEKGPAEF